MVARDVGVLEPDVAVPRAPDDDAALVDRAALSVDRDGDQLALDAEPSGVAASVGWGARGW